MINYQISDYSSDLFVFLSAIRLYPKQELRKSTQSTEGERL